MVIVQKTFQRCCEVFLQNSGNDSIPVFPDVPADILHLTRGELGIGGQENQTFLHPISPLEGIVLPRPDPELHRGQAIFADDHIGILRRQRAAVAGDIVLNAALNHTVPAGDKEGLLFKFKRVDSDVVFHRITSKFIPAPPVPAPA